MAKERLEIDVVADTTKAQKGLKDLAGTAEQSSAKIKTSFTDRIGGGIQNVAAKIPGLNKLIGPGLQSAASVGTGAIAGFATGAGAAIAKFATDSVGHFEELGLTIGKFRDSTGLAADQSSRFVEVAKDLGIPVDSLQGALGKMNKAAGSTPGIFKAAGIEIARTKDGTFDANQTFLNTVDVLSGIKDANERADLASRIFGRSYQGISEVIFGGSEKIRKSFEGVSKTKIFDDEKIDKARKLRDAFDEFHDAIDDVELSLGENLAPAATKAATATAQLVEDAKPLLSLLTPIADGLSAFAGGLGTVVDVAGRIKGALGPVGAVFDGIAAGGKAIARSFVDPIGAVAGLGRSIGGLFGRDKKKDIDDTSAAVQAYGSRYSALAASISQASAIEAQSTAVRAANDEASRKAAESTRALADAMDRARDSALAEFDAFTTLADANLALNQAVRDLAALNANAESSNDDVAAAAKRVAGENRAAAQAQADANQKTFTANDAAHALAAGYDLSAGALSNHLTPEILSYIATQLGVPESQVTQFVQQGMSIAKGDAAALKRLIDNIPSVKTTTYTIHTVTTGGPRGAGGADGDPTTPIATGGVVRAGSKYTVNEIGAEPFFPTVDGRVLSHSDAMKALRGGGGGGGTMVINQTINYPAGADPARYRNEQRRLQRRNGSS